MSCSCGHCTRVNCKLTGCKYNSACCANPIDTETYCTLESIDLLIDEETGIIECAQWVYDYEKDYECTECQLDKHGEIELNIDLESIEVDNIEDLFE